MKYSDELLGSITPIDNDAGNLNSLPDFQTIEGRVILIETANEVLSRINPESDQAQAIRAALGELERADLAADQHDADNQCGTRDIIRGRFFS